MGTVIQVDAPSDLEVTTSIKSRTNNIATCIDGTTSNRELWYTDTTYLELSSPNQGRGAERPEKSTWKSATSEKYLIAVKELCIIRISFDDIVSLILCSRNRRLY